MELATHSISQIEQAVLSLPEQVKIDPVHQFAPGVYARTIVIPANTVLTGAKHKTTHLNIVSQGEIVVFNELGQEKSRIKAPAIFVSEAGTQRAGLAISETVWTTIHPTNETNIEQLEADLVENYHGQLMGGTTCLS